jgi:hypothetical protein
MRWERWHDWTAEDPRWSFEVIDTDALAREQVATRVVAWARAVLDGRRPPTGWGVSVNRTYIDMSDHAGSAGRHEHQH